MAIDEIWQVMLALTFGGWTAWEMRAVSSMVVVLCLAGITWIDVRRWEIDPWLCAIAALAGGVIADLDGSWPSSLLGAAIGMGLALLIGWTRPSAIGQGDYYLYGLCGFLVGINGILPWALMNAVLALIFTFCLARRRNRRFRRCAIPAALPACPAACLVAILMTWPMISMMV